MLLLVNLLKSLYFCFCFPFGIFSELFQLLYLFVSAFFRDSANRDLACQRIDFGFQLRTSPFESLLNSCSVILMLLLLL